MIITKGEYPPSSRYLYPHLFILFISVEFKNHAFVKDTRSM